MALVLADCCPLPAPAFDPVVSGCLLTTRAMQKAGQMTGSGRAQMDVQVCAIIQVGARNSREGGASTEWAAAQG